jgi:hypothetical protein
MHAYSCDLKEQLTVEHVMTITTMLEIGMQCKLLSFQENLGNPNKVDAVTSFEVHYVMTFIPQM